jgi:hypothetical protein
MTSLYPPSRSNHNSSFSAESDLFNWFDDILQEKTASVMPTQTYHLENDNPMETAIAAGTHASLTHETATAAQKSVAAIVALKAELEKMGSLEKPELREPLQALAELVREIYSRGGPRSLDLLQGQVKELRQRVAAIAQQMQQTQELTTLLQVVTDNLQRALQAERVLIYRLDQVDRGTVLMETMQPGWTPTLSEILPIQSFGINAVADLQKQPIVAIADVYPDRSEFGV